MKQKIIAKRNLYLLLTDHLVNNESYLEPEQLEAVKTYRTELRNLPQQDPDFKNWVFPTEPECCRDCLYWIGQIIK